MWIVLYYVTSFIGCNMLIRILDMLDKEILKVRQLRSNVSS